MLQSLSIKNLGCYDDSDNHNVTFSPETILIGPNNSGKSMLLTGLNILRYYSIRGGALWSSDMYNLIDFQNAVYFHDMGRTIDLSMTIDGKPIFLKIFSNGRIEASPFTTEIQNLMKTIWYLRPNRSTINYNYIVGSTGSPLQPLEPSGANISNFMLERFTEQDARWVIAQEWFKKFNSKITMLRTPIRGNNVYLETIIGKTPINLSLQGSGIQSSMSIFAALIFSPPESTIIIEEPEAYLHSSSQEVMIDLINEMVNTERKQIIFSTHSWDMILAICKDLGIATRRTADHVKVDKTKLSFKTFTPNNGSIKIEDYSPTGKFADVRKYFFELWG